MPTADTPPLVGSCRGCGYALQGLESRRCPECGRVFDPGNPKTMNMGRKPGWLARKLMRPIGWPTVLLMFLGTAAIAFTTRLQEGNPLDWDWSFVDLKFYLVREDWASKSIFPWAITLTDRVYSAGLAAVVIALVSMVMRPMVALITRSWYRAEATRAVLTWRAALILLLLFMTSLICTSAGWPYRLGQNWAAARRGFGSDLSSLRIRVQRRPAAVATMPVPLNDRRQQMMIEAALRYGSSTSRRGALAIAAERIPLQSLSPIIRRMLETERDPSVLVPAIRVAAKLADVRHLAAIEARLKDPDAHVRTAAMDTLTYWSSREFTFNSGPEEIVSDPPIDVSSFWTRHLFDPTRPRLIDYPDVRSLSRFVPTATRMLVDGQTREEREAGARFLRFVPPADYRLRVVEWSVWIDGREGGERGGDDYVPPLVSRYADPLLSVFSRRTTSGVEREPAAGALAPATLTGIDVVNAVVFGNVDRPMVLSVNVQPSAGRAIGAHPLPDSYVLADVTWAGRTAAPQPLSALPAPAGTFQLPPGSADHEWLRGPPSPFGPPLFWRPARTVTSVGFAWRHLVLLPDRASWMHPPAVPADPKFAWWSRLRDVPSSWVSSRGESERFLYYDGPTLLPSPVIVREAPGGVLMLRATGHAEDRSEEDQPDYAGVSSIDALSQTARKGRRTERRGMFITVAGGKATAEIVPVPVSGKKADPPMHIIGSGKEVEGAASAGISAAEALLREWIIDAGLTSAEVDGMMFAWRKQFFETDGRRFVLLMSAVDYDGFCPISIHPKPTEMARVGLVWTEMTPPDSGPPKQRATGE